MCSSVASGCRNRVASVRAPETRTLLRMRLREAITLAAPDANPLASRPADLFFPTAPSRARLR
jgi:hypothetical protein